MGKTSLAAVAKYKKKTYTRIGADIPKATATAFKEKCKKEGISQSQIIKKAIEEFIKD